MRLVLVVEDEKSGKRLYKKWISYVCPRLTFVNKIQEIVDNSAVVVMGPALKMVMGGFFPFVSLGSIFAH